MLSKKIKETCRHAYFYNEESITIDKIKMLAEHHKFRDTVILYVSCQFIDPEFHETHVEDVDLSNSEDVDPKGFRAFIRWGHCDEFGNDRFKFKLRLQCRCCRKRQFGGTD